MGNTLRFKIAWTTFVVLCIGIGLYPLIYLVIPDSEGLLSSKTPELLESLSWRIPFYIHISFGGLALLIGWIQFSKKIREKNISLHRTIGKMYVIAVLLSGFSGLYIAYYATGGAITAAGFIALGILWLYTTIKSFLSIRAMNIKRHQELMIYSYALCFAAVSLRIQMPFLIAAFGDFLPAYKIVAWSCWIPNLIVAFIITQKRQSPISVSSD